MAIEKPADYLRHGNQIAATRTQCGANQCRETGCDFPNCSVDYQAFESTQAADIHEAQLRRAGNVIKQEEF